jgi:tRNA-dihydrouridine synthase
MAPMDGITDCAYRIICKEIFEKHKNPEDELLLRTEFMSAEGYVHNPIWVVKHLLTTNYATPVIAQIFGGIKESLVTCAKDIDLKYNFQGIELNMGCPSPKIYTCAAGSGMLRDKEQTLDIIKEIAENITTPFSIKTRIWLNKEDQEAQMAFLLAAAPFVKIITIHGRTFGQSHAGEVNRDFIYELKKQLSNHTIIGNGGLRTYEDWKNKLMSQQNTALVPPITLDWMMRGQSGIGNPRILTPHHPSPEETKATMIHHLNLMMLTELFFEEQKKSRSGTLSIPSYNYLLEQEQDMLRIINDSEHIFRSPTEFRKYLFCYINGLPGNKALKQTIAQTKNYQEVISAIQIFFG